MPSEKPDFLKIIFFPLLCLSCVLSLIRFSMNIGFSAYHSSRCVLHRLYSYTSSRLYPCKTYQMGSSGLEPPTSRLSGARSNLLSYEPAARCRLRTRTFFGLVLKFSPGPLLLDYSISSMKFALALRILFSSLLRFRACPVKAIGLSVSLA